MSIDEVLRQLNSLTVEDSLSRIMRACLQAGSLLSEVAPNVRYMDLFAVAVVHYDRCPVCLTTDFKGICPICIAASEIPQVRKFRGDFTESDETKKCEMLS